MFILARHSGYHVSVYGQKDRYRWMFHSPNNAHGSSFCLESDGTRTYAETIGDLKTLQKLEKNIGGKSFYLFLSYIH